MYNIYTNISLMRLIESWATTENPFNSTEEILTWIDEKNKAVKVDIKRYHMIIPARIGIMIPRRAKLGTRMALSFKLRGFKK